MTYQEWAEKQKRPWTDITAGKGKYWLCECGSVCDKEWKRAQKITVRYPGEPPGKV